VGVVGVSRMPHDCKREKRTPRERESGRDFRERRHGRLGLEFRSRLLSGHTPVNCLPGQQHREEGGQPRQQHNHGVRSLLCLIIASLKQLVTQAIRSTTCVRV